MIKNIKLHINNNPKSIRYSELVREEFIKNNFNIVDDTNFDLGIAIGGDGTFLHMIKQNEFNSTPFYVGINTGHLGFLQEVKINELHKLIYEIKENKYLIDQIDVQETTIKNKQKEYKYNSLNEIVIRDKKLDILKTSIYINDDFLEMFTGDGIMIATSTGSTAYNLNYGGSIVYPTFSTLQITPIAPINSKVYKSITNSIIIPSKYKVKLVTQNKEILVTVDGENNYFNEIESITSNTKDKKVKCLRFSHYNFPQKINEKFLS